jgi:protein-arginine kinase activator protein McsA
MELAFLLRWRKEIDRDRPIGPVERLEQQLERAVALEDYEEAARLRDQIVRLRGGEVADHGPSRSA